MPARVAVQLTFDPKDHRAVVREAKKYDLPVATFLRKLVLDTLPTYFVLERKPAK